MVGLRRKVLALAGWRGDAALPPRVAAVALAGLLLLGGPGAALAQGAADNPSGSGQTPLATGGSLGGFSDVPKGFWAEQAIDRMSAKGIIQGNAGRFEPSRDLTRWEALALMVRSLGLEASAQARTGIPEAFREAGTVPAWARGYVAEAVARGLLSSTELNAFRGGEKATRLQVAAWIVRALGMDAEAQATPAPANYTDLGNVLLSWRGYVTVISDMGIMTGAYNLFRPFDPVPRAEMAAITARLDRFLQNDLDNLESEGTVESMSGVLTLKLADGSRRSFTVDTGLVAYFDGVKASPNMIMAGDHVTVIADSAGRALYAEVTTQPLSVQGTVAQVSAAARSLTVSTDKGPRTFALPVGAGIIVNGKPAAFSKLRSGQRVTVEGQGSTVTRIVAESQTARLRGEVTSLAVQAGGDILLGVRFPRDGGSDDRVLTVSSGIPFTLNGEPARLINLQVRDRVTVQFADDKVVRIAGESYERTLKGTVLTVYYEDKPRLAISLAAESAWAADGSAGASAATFPLAGDAKISKDGSDAGLTSLRPGDDVELHLVGDEVARVVATTRYTSVQGTVEKLTIGDPLEITVRTAAGRSVTYRVAPDVTVKAGAGYVSFLGLKPGSRVELAVAYDVVTSIKVSGQGLLGDIRGVVRYVDLSEGRFVVDLDGGGLRHVKPAGSFVLVLPGGQVRDKISYLSESDTVIAVGSDVPGDAFSAQVVVVTGRAGQ